MNLKNYIRLSAALVLGFGAASCSNDETELPASKNLIYLSIEGNSTITEGSSDAITVKVELSAPAANDVSLDFAVIGDNFGALSVTPSPLRIAKGQNSATLSITSAQSNFYTTQTAMSLNIPDLDTEIYTLRENVTFFLNPAAPDNGLTTEQQELVDAYRSTYGIDLTPWLGAVDLTGTIEFPGGGSLASFEEPTTIQLTGTTQFALSADADKDHMVLAMTDNPMGMANYLHTAFRKLTVEDAEYFANPEAGGAGTELMNLLEWNSSSTEVFGVSLDNLRIVNFNAATKTADIEYVEEGPAYVLDSNGKPIYSDLFEDYLLHNYSESRIPFAFTYTAWDRMLSLIESANPEATELMAYTTSHPATFLGMSDVLTDVWELDEEDGVNLYVEPLGKIDFEAGTMTFKFPFDHSDQYGYSRVTVNYTLK